MATVVPFRGRGSVEQRRDDITRIGQMTVKPTRVSGYVTLVHPADATASEASTDIDFPVVFTEKPVFTFGAELGDNHRARAGVYPTVSAVVVRWDTQGEIAGATEGRFAGATVASVTTGQAGQVIVLHYSFEGKAIRNPVSGADSLGDL